MKDADQTICSLSKEVLFLLKEVQKESSLDVKEQIKVIQKKARLIQYKAQKMENRLKKYRNSIEKLGFVREP